MCPSCAPNSLTSFSDFFKTTYPTPSLRTYSGNVLSIELPEPCIPSTTIPPLSIQVEMFEDRVFLVLPGASLQATHDLQGKSGLLYRVTDTALVTPDLLHFGLSLCVAPQECSCAPGVVCWDLSPQDGPSKGHFSRCAPSLIGADPFLVCAFMRI